MTVSQSLQRVITNWAFELVTRENCPKKIVKQPSSESTFTHACWVLLPMSFFCLEVSLRVGCDVKSQGVNVNDICHHSRENTTDVCHHQCITKTSPMTLNFVWWQLVGERFCEEKLFVVRDSVVKSRLWREVLWWQVHDDNCSTIVSRAKTRAGDTNKPPLPKM